MRIAVIDHEKLTRMELVRLIYEDFPQAEIYEAGSGVQAMQLLEKKTFDFLFIDVRLGDMEGTTVASLARRLIPDAKIIFATAYSEYAVTAFELQANDYILKPYGPARIRQILGQYEKTHPEQDDEFRIAVNTNRRHTVLLALDEITYIGSDGSGKHCVIHALTGEQYSDNTALGVFEERLRGKRFYRIHKSYLVHLKYVQDIFPWSGSDFALRVRGSSAKLPISRDKLKGLRAYLHI